MISFRYLMKKFRYVFFFALLLNLPILIVCTVRTDKGIILTGDTVEFTSVVDVDGGYAQSGSFSTIYVMNLDNTTLFQNYVAGFDSMTESYDIVEGTAAYSMTDSENYFAGKLQYASSITQCLIAAYTKAKEENSSIQIDYSFNGFYITYHGENSELHIGDLITGIRQVKTDDDGYILDENGNYTYEDTIYPTDYDAYNEAMHNVMVGDIFIVSGHESVTSDYKVKSDGTSREVVLKSGESFGWYKIYDINLETISPKVTLRSNYVGGPSGGLLQTLSVYNQLTSYDYTHGLKIAGTGTINAETLKVGSIGGISEKIPTAISDDVDVFFCPEENYEEAYNKYITVRGHEKMALVQVSTLDDAINYLKEVTL